MSAPLHDGTGFALPNGKRTQSPTMYIGHWTREAEKAVKGKTPEEARKAFQAARLALLGVLLSGIPLEQDKLASLWVLYHVCPNSLEPAMDCDCPLHEED